VRDFIIDGEVMRVAGTGAALLRQPLVNKGSAFTREERAALGLEGLLPPQVSTLEQQVARAHRQIAAASSPLARYQLLRALQDRQEILYYALLAAHLEEMLPIVYTPTVGDACRDFSALFQGTRGITLTPDDVDRVDAILANVPEDDVRMIVATDSSAILGIGDQGWGGLGISIGKLALYTVAGGVSPFQALPVVLDVGTERSDLLEDPGYLGVRRRRVRGAAYLALVDRFARAVRARWPRAVLQWEDFAKDAAFTVLERHQATLPSFNDDIQGTGATALAGLLGACQLRGERLAEQRIVIHGAGAGGIGVAWALRQGLVADGLTADEARERIYVLDSQGLLTQARALDEYKRPFARAWDGPADLHDVVAAVQPSVLIGLSGQGRAFDEPIIRALRGPRPIVFALSNPTCNTEALPADILAWTDGRAIVATGSPFPDTAQGNNAFIFPGLGLGTILSGARRVTDGMVLEAARALADHTAERHLPRGRVYPPVTELAEVAIRVAARVMARAAVDGVGDGGDEALVRARFWRPRYLRCAPSL
jgi:malate dehydrogenase (oxaloacetate-decarboxylating)